MRKYEYRVITKVVSQGQRFALDNGERIVGVLSSEPATGRSRDAVEVTVLVELPER